MGYLVGTKCHADQSSASDAWFSAIPQSYTAGATSYTAWPEKGTSGWQFHRQSIASDGTVTDLGAVVATVPQFATCDPTEQFFDGMTVGWGVVLLMVMAWGFLQTRRAAR